MNSIQRKYVACSFGEIHLTVWDNVSDCGGPTVLLLNSRPRSLQKLNGRLKYSRRAIIADIPGLGLSSPPFPGASMFDVAGAIVGALDACGEEQIDLFGCHTGHKVATALASRWPSRVRKLILAGKTHSLIGNSVQRNEAMASYVSRRPPDVALALLEGVYVDDKAQTEGFQRIFEANYAFEFRESLRTVLAPTLFIEITTSEEDGIYGRQASVLAGLMKHAKSMEYHESDATGLDLYIGSTRMAREVDEFLAAR